MLRNLVLAVNVSTAVLGFALLGLAGALHFKALQHEQPLSRRLVHADDAVGRGHLQPDPSTPTARSATHPPPLLPAQLFALGAAVLLLSFLGLLGSRARARWAACWLSCYGLCLLLLLLALCAVGVYAYSSGASGLSAELDSHWHVVQAVVQEDIGVQDIGSKDDFVAALRYHRLALAIAAGLLALGLLLLLCASCVLRRYISGPKYETTPSEMATLLDDDHEVDIL